MTKILLLVLLVLNSCSTQPDNGTAIPKVNEEQVRSDLRFYTSNIHKNMTDNLIYTQIWEQFYKTIDVDTQIPSFSMKTVYMDENNTKLKEIEISLLSDYKTISSTRYQIFDLIERSNADIYDIDYDNPLLGTKLLGRGIYKDYKVYERVIRHNMLQFFNEDPVVDFAIITESDPMSADFNLREGRLYKIANNNLYEVYGKIYNENFNRLIINELDLDLYFYTKIN